MTGLWRTLSRLVEAKSLDRLKDDLHRYMIRRYGEHAADEAMTMMQSQNLRTFARSIEGQYFDSRINSLVQDMIKASAPDEPAGARGQPARDDRPPAEPGQSTDKGSGPSEPIPQRPDRAGAQPRGIEPLIRPGTRQGQEPGTAGQNPKRDPGYMRGPKKASGALGVQATSGPKVSQDVQPSELPQKLADLRAQRDRIKADPRKGPEVAKLDAQIAQLTRGGESTLMDRQRQVDYVTQTYGVEAGERLARKLRVPTSAERGGELAGGAAKRMSFSGPFAPGAGGQGGGEWKKKPTILNPDAIAKRMDPDVGTTSVPDRASELPTGEPGATKGGTVKPMHKVYNPQTKEMELQVRPGDFPWQKWQPHGVSKKVMTKRPDAALGIDVRGSRYTNPATEGEPLFWDPDARDWVTKSVAATRRAQMKAGGGDT